MNHNLWFISYQWKEKYLGPLNPVYAYTTLWEYNQASYNIEKDSLCKNETKKEELSNIIAYVFIEEIEQNKN